MPAMSISQRVKSSIVDFIVTGGGSGLSPISPGTVGSVAALIFWYILSSSKVLFSPSAIILLAVTTSAIGVAATHLHLLRHPTIKDPGYIVIDEWAGMFFALTAVESDQPFFIVLAFALFRLLDITKPWIIGRAERCNGALGVMLDDIVAGILAGAIVAGTKLLLP